MKTRYRATGDSNKQEGEHVAGPNGASAINKFGNGWHFELGCNKHNAQRERDDGANFQEGR